MNLYVVKMDVNWCSQTPLLQSFDRSVSHSVGRSPGRSVCLLSSWSIVPLVNRSVGLSFSWSIVQLINRSVGLSFSWSIVHLVYWSVRRSSPLSWVNPLHQWNVNGIVTAERLHRKQLEAKASCCGSVFSTKYSRCCSVFLSVSVCLSFCLFVSLRYASSFCFQYRRRKLKINSVFASRRIPRIVLEPLSCISV